MNRPITDRQQSEEIAQHLGCMPWEWFVTLNCQDDADLDRAEHLLKRWRKNVFGLFVGQTCYEGFFLHKPNKHMHLLMLARPNRFGHTLADIEKKSVTELEKRWFAMARRSAKILPVSSSIGIAGYVTGKKNMMSHHWETLNPCGIKLLNRLRKAA